MDYEKLHKDTIAKLQEMVNSGKITVETACGICADFVPDSEDEMIRKDIVAAVESYGDFTQGRKEEIYTWLKKHGEQILANSAKTCKDEQKPAKWHREDEQNLNACLGYIPDEFLRRWLTDIIHVKYDKSVELPKDEDYGIDGLYAAVDILKKTIGKVDGYQSDDGILEHKCAISAVKELSKQQKSFWSEEDKKMSRFIGNAITADGASEYLKSKGIQVIDAHVWLEEFKERVQPQSIWKPSEEMLEALYRAIPENVMAISEDEMLLDKLYQGLKYGRVLGKN